MSIEFDDEFTEFPRVTREVVAEADEQTLLHWFAEIDKAIVQMRAFLESYREAEIDDTPYYRRTAGALAFAKISSKWIERRLLGMGITPPYPPEDPRGRQLRFLADRVEKLKNRVAELERLVLPVAA